MYSDNNKSQGSVLHILGVVVLLHNRIIIVLLAFERIFKIGTLLTKLQEIGLIASHALFEVHCPGEKVQILPDNLRMVDNSCYSLLLFLKQSNSERNSESELLSF